MSQNINKKKTSIIVKILIFLTLGLWYFIFNRKKNELPVVEYVDLDRYSGKWYEIATIQEKNEKDYSNVSEEYYLTDEGYIKIIYNYTKDIIKDIRKSIEAKAYPVKKSNNAKFRVEFFWPFKEDYLIIDLDKNYQYTMVGNRKRTYLCILSRTLDFEQEIYTDLLKKAEELGFNVNKIKKTDHFKPKKQLK
jgi:apolipoprotein D and lipocalin family protein